MLSALFFVTLIPIAALLVIADYRHYQRDRAQAEEAAFSLAQQVADNVEFFLADARKLTERLASRPLLQDMDPAKCAQMTNDVRDLLFPQFANFSVANAKGEMICSTVPQPNGVRTDLSSTDWFRKITREPGFVVSAPLTGRVSQRAISVLAYPVRNERGQMIGSVQLPIDLLNFKLIPGVKKLPASTVVAIIDSDGTTVARSVQGEKYVGTNRRGVPVVDTILSQKQGVARTVSAENIERIYGFLPIKGTDWYAFAGIDTDSVFRESRETTVRNAAFGLLIILVAAALAIVLGNRIAAPIGALRDVARRVSEGQLDQRAAVVGPAEIAAVAAQFNAMMDAIGESRRDLSQKQQELAQLNDSLETRVAERTKQLEQANRELEAFSYSVSHDLRGPLRNISGFASLLLSHDRHLDDRARQHVQRILSSTNRMNQVIEGLLALARTNSNTLRITDVDLAALVADIRDDLMADAEQRAVEWHIDPLPTIRGDAGMFAIAFTNLLSNALKYSSERQPAIIHIGTDPAPPGRVIIHVRDNGAGFDMRYVAKLFQPFQRLHTDDRFAGAGIGLATVARIVERHGGRIRAEGEPDRGAIFFIDLPLS